MEGESLERSEAGSSNLPIIPNPHGRSMFFIAIVFLTGHCALHALPRLPDFSTWFVIAALLLLSIALIWKRSRYLGTLGLALALGFGLAWWSASHRLAERWPESKTGWDIELNGFIASIVE